MVALTKKLSLPSADEKYVLDELEYWKRDGKILSFNWVIFYLPHWQ